MGLVTDKISIGNASLGSYTLDVSGNILIDSLSGSGIRLVVPDTTGVLSTSALPGGTINETGLVGMFGDASDGNVTISSGTTTLTREMNYNNLTLNAGARLETAGYTVRVKGTLDMRATSYISCNGDNGGNATSSAIGSGGTSPMSAARYAWQGRPGNGGNGENRVSVGNSNGTGATGGGATAATTSYGPGWFRCGAGGGGGGAHGSATGRTAPVNGTATWHGYSGGTGSTATGSSTSVIGRGGGGGAGGGICLVYARDISVNSTSTYIEANGGNGGAGWNGLSAIGGGGGGGAGGTAILVYQTFSVFMPTVRANGGSVGSYGTGGTSGGAGNAFSYRLWNPDFILSTYYIYPPASGGTYTVNVTTDPKSMVWDASENTAWFSLTTPSGTGDASFGVVVDQQSDGNPQRSAMITVSSLNIPKVPKRYLSIIQDASEVIEDLTISQRFAENYSYYEYCDWDFNSDTHCNFYQLDVSSSAAWTSQTSGDGAFYISPTLGSAGNTVVTIYFSGVDDYRSDSFSFEINSTNYANLDCYSTDICT